MRYSFAHGGKDGIPYPVDRETYDKTINIMAKTINRARLGREEKTGALFRLRRLLKE